MAINVVVTLFVVVVGSFFGLSPGVPLAPLLLGLGVFAVAFPVAFYPISRGLWAAVLYLTGDNAEGD